MDGQEHIDFDKLLKQDEFRAVYFELLYLQSQIALELACGDMGTVRAGMEMLNDKLDLYREIAKNSEVFKQILYNKSRTTPPKDLFLWLMQLVEEHRRETSNVSASGAESANQESSNL